MGFILREEQNRAAVFVDLEAILRLAEQQREQDVERIRDLEEQLRISEAAKVKAEAEVSELRALCDDKEIYIEKLFGRFQSFKDKILRELVNVRVDTAKEFCTSPTGRFDKELAYDKARLDGFTTYIGQLVNKRVIQKDLELKQLEIECNNNIDGTFTL